MLKDQIPHTAPHTRERASRLQRNYLRRNSFGLAILCTGHVILGTLYSDPPVVLYFGLFVLVCVSYGWLSSKIPHHIYIPLGEFLFILSVTLGQLVLPLEESSVIFLLPLGVTFMAFSHTLLRGVVVFAIGVIGFFSFPYLGFGSFVVGAIPNGVSFGLTLVFCTVTLLFQVGNARKRVQFSMKRLTDVEDELNSKETVLNEYKRSLSGLNSELDEKVKILVRAFEKEALVNAELQRERASQVELTKAIHRDLREPLHKIIASNKQLTKSFEEIPEAESVASYLDYATDGAKRMATMLDDLLKYTESNSSQKVEEINLNELLNVLCQDLSDLIKRSSAKVTFKDLPVVEGFPTQLYQLFQNLLTNALKFTKPGESPRVSIFPAKVQQTTGRYLILVKDNGVGIPENKMESIFGLFNRAHSKENYEGSGVGLALCRRIAVTHDAELTVDSVEGEGTQFTIAFPAESIIDFYVPTVNEGVNLQV